MEKGQHKCKVVSGRIQETRKIDSPRGWRVLGSDLRPARVPRDKPSHIQLKSRGPLVTVPVLGVVFDGEDILK